MFLIIAQVFVSDLPGVDHDLFAGLAIHKLGFAPETELVFHAVGDVEDQHLMVAGAEVFEAFDHLAGVVQKV